MCGEAGCLQCGFTPATSRLLFGTIISCSIIQMIFTRASYTGHVLQRKWPRYFTVALRGGRVVLPRLFEHGQKRWLDLLVSQGVSLQSQGLF